MREFSKFLTEFIRHPVSTGAIAPSSPALAHAMVEWIDWPRVQTVLEYGPGTGAFTGAILSRSDSSSRYLGIERNAGFIVGLSQRFEGIEIVHDSVEHVRSICDSHGIDRVDAIVCGLPWAAFSDRLQSACLDAMMEVLVDGGQFVTFAYLQGLLLPAGQRFRRKLQRYFSSVEKSATVWKNLPPAFVYQCRK